MTNNFTARLAQVNLASKNNTDESVKKKHILMIN